jgi:hypothetical protein
MVATSMIELASRDRSPANTGRRADEPQNSAVSPLTARALAVSGSFCETVCMMNGASVERLKNLRWLWYLLAVVIATSGWLLLKEFG